MFGFEKDEAEGLGSKGRFAVREERFIGDKKPAPAYRHRSWWLLHNCIAHPLLGIAPSKPTFWFHDWTSRRLNHDEDG